MSSSSPCSLVMFKANGKRHDFPLTKDITIMGRGHGCGLRIPLTSVSREHCQVERREDGYYLSDLGSSNGTIHNNKRVQDVKLEAGDSIMIGPVHFTVVVDGIPADIDPVKTIIDDNGGSRPLSADERFFSGEDDDDADDSGMALLHKEAAKPAADVPDQIDDSVGDMDFLDDSDERPAMPATLDDDGPALTLEDDDDDDLDLGAELLSKPEKKPDPTPAPAAKKPAPAASKDDSEIDLDDLLSDQLGAPSDDDDDDAPVTKPTKAPAAASQESDDDLSFLDELDDEPEDAPAPKAAQKADDDMVLIPDSEEEDIDEDGTAVTKELPTGGLVSNEADELDDLLSMDKAAIKPAPDPKTKKSEPEPATKAAASSDDDADDALSALESLAESGDDDDFDIDWGGGDDEEDRGGFVID